MRIDYMQNPLGIVKRFDIPYSNGELHLEGRVIAHEEDGFSEVTWFDGKVVYNNPDWLGRTRHYEVGGMDGELPFQVAYQALSKGSSSQEEVEQMLRNWCKSMNIGIAAEVGEPAGITG